MSRFAPMIKTCFRMLGRHARLTSSRFRLAQAADSRPKMTALPRCRYAAAPPARVPTTTIHTPHTQDIFIARKTLLLAEPKSTMSCRRRRHGEDDISSTIEKSAQGFGWRPHERRRAGLATAAGHAKSSFCNIFVLWHFPAAFGLSAVACQSATYSTAGTRCIQCNDAAKAAMGMIN